MNEIASRYALALFSICEENHRLDETQLEIKQIKEIFLENEEFIDVLSSAFLSHVEKIKMLEDVLKGVDEDIISLLKVVVNNNRTSFIYDIFDEFNSLCNEHKGILEGIIYSTEKLDKGVIEEIASKISKKEKRNIELKNKIDPSLIGGVKVVIHDRVYDGSIKNQIEQLKDNLLKKEKTLYEN